MSLFAAAWLGHGRFPWPKSTRSPCKFGIGFVRVVTPLGA